MKNIIIGTPSTEGKLDVHWVDSLNKTMQLGMQLGYNVSPLFICYDALVQRARNDIFQIAFQNNIDYLFWIDSDIGWNPTDFFKIINYNKHFIGGTYRKKTDEQELYVLRIKDNETKLEINTEGLIEVQGLGMGFTCMDNYAIKKIWENTPKYIENNIEKRMAFNVSISNEIIKSEDITFCDAWTNLDEKIYVDPSITCSHTGIKTFYGNFLNWLDKNKIEE